MNWADYKEQITALDKEELEQIELVAQLIVRRKKLGMSQRELAQRSGLQQPAIARLEREGNIPRLDTLGKISKALGLRLILVEEDKKVSETSVL